MALRRPSRWLGALCLTLGSAAATWALLWWIGPAWSDYAPATCLGSRCFCEAPRFTALALQPANTWSSFGFVALGAWIMLAARRPAAGSAFGGGLAAWLGLTAVLIGVGSALLHATLTLWGQFLDVLGMYLLGSFVLGYALARRWRLGRPAAIGLYTGLCAVLIGLLWQVPETRRWLFALLLITAIAAEWWLARPLRAGVEPCWFVYGLLVQTLAFALWWLDNTQRLCWEDSLLQGHAVWHLLGAVALACNYRYYRSEKPLLRHPPARAH